MRIHTYLTATACLVAVAGCTSVRHSHQPNQLVGTTLPIEVNVNAKAEQSVSGTVHHRVDGRGDYTASPMNRRANQLWAMLPTDDLAPDESVQYYIDITIDGKLFTLGSPGSPYCVNVLDKSNMIMAGLQDQAYATNSSREVRIVLHAGDHPIGQPSIVYQIPGLPGDIRSPMEEDGRGNYQLLVPARSTRPGTWRYAIEVPLDGSTHRLPAEGFRIFQVERPQQTAAAAEE